MNPGAAATKCPAPGATSRSAFRAVASVGLNVIQRQLGHANLGVTSVYLQGIDSAEVIEAVHSRRPPMISATAPPARSSIFDPKKNDVAPRRSGFNKAIAGCWGSKGVEDGTPLIPTSAHI